MITDRQSMLHVCPDVPDATLFDSVHCLWGSLYVVCLPPAASAPTGATPNSSFAVSDLFKPLHTQKQCNPTHQQEQAKQMHLSGFEFLDLLKR